MRKIVIMPDSYKNTMSSGTVCEVIKETLLEEDDSLNIYTYELADGGEGTGVILSKYFCCIRVSFLCNKKISLHIIISDNISPYYNNFFKS